MVKKKREECGVKTVKTDLSESEKSSACIMIKEGTNWWLWSKTGTLKNNWLQDEPLEDVLEC